MSDRRRCRPHCQPEGVDGSGSSTNSGRCGATGPRVVRQLRRRQAVHLASFHPQAGRLAGHWADRLCAPKGPSDRPPDEHPDAPPLPPAEAPELPDACSELRSATARPCARALGSGGGRSTWEGLI
eukprot:15467005-Alexandrium_andersonii.AAC.1